MAAQQQGGRKTGGVVSVTIAALVLSAVSWRPPRPRPAMRAWSRHDDPLGFPKASIMRSGL
jgi:hypothetical protein